MTKGNSPYLILTVLMAMLVEGCEVTVNMSLYAAVPNWIKEIPDHLKTQEMCNEAVRMEPWSLKFVPDHLKTK